LAVPFAVPLASGLARRGRGANAVGQPSSKQKAAADWRAAKKHQMVGLAARDRGNEL
jgi:hypothetical protein